MPPRLKRFYENADLHFVTFSCYHRKANLQTPLHKDLFVSILERVRQQYLFSVIGYVAMPEYVHLLLGRLGTANLSVVVQVLKQIVSRKISQEDFWQRSFCDFNMRTEVEGTETLRYLHRNPVARGLVERDEDWPWSSFRYYFFGEQPLITIASWLLNGWRPSVDRTLRPSAKDGAPGH
jgi:putative transposase